MRFSAALSLSATAVAAYPDVVSELNNRFNNGKVSSDVHVAGVLMHHFSKSNAWELDEPWRPYTPEECAAGNYPHCDKSDRGSTLLVNNQVRDPADNAIPLYAPNKGGIIFNPDHVGVLCAYSEDGGTDDRANRGCGCSSGDLPCEERKTKNSCVLDAELGVADYTRCWWGAEDLDEMMKRQASKYNEVVLSTDPWLEFMPESIEAFFYAKGAEKLEATLQIYVDFQKKNPDSCVPLVEMDNYALENPFYYSSHMKPNAGCQYDGSTPPATTTPVMTTSTTATTTTPQVVTTTTTTTTTAVVTTAAEPTQPSTATVTPVVTTTAEPVAPSSAFTLQTTLCSVTLVAVLSVF